MNGEERDTKDVAEEDVADEQLTDTVVIGDDQMTETVVITEDDVDDVGDLSVELNVEKLVEKLESADEEDVHHKAEVRRKLEELNEQREKELDSTFNFNLDDDL